MADRKLISSGNCNNPAIFDGGTLPASTDNLYLNGFNLTLAADFTVASITNQANAGISAVAGGAILASFGVGVTRTLTANLSHASGTVLCTPAGAGTFNIIGNLTAGTGSASDRVISSNMTGILNVFGNLTGGTGSQVCAIYVNSTGDINITGNVSSGTGGYGLWIRAQVARITVIGTVQSNLMPAIAVTNGITIPDLTVNGHVIRSVGHTFAIANDTGTVPIYVQNIEGTISGDQPISGKFLFTNGNVWHRTYRKNGTQITLTDPLSVADQVPDESDVREGTVYLNSTRTGSLKVPPAASVLVGVPVDNTLGSAVFSAESILDAIESSDHPMAQRLRNVSTVQSVGAQIESSLQ